MNGHTIGFRRQTKKLQLTTCLHNWLGGGGGGGVVGRSSGGERVWGALSRLKYRVFMIMARNLL